MAAWQDFILADEKSATAWGTLTSNAVQQHSLIIAYAAHYDSKGSAPALKLSGAAHRIVAEMPSQPYRTFFPYTYWVWHYRYYGYYPYYRWLWPYYYYGYYPWWWGHWVTTYVGYWHTTSNIVIAFADEPGTISVEGYGTATLLNFKLKVFNTVLTTSNDKALVKVSFQRNDTRAVYASSYQGTIGVLADDILVLFGNALSTSRYNQLGLTLGSSPNVQVLLSENALYNQYPYGASYAHIVRIKENGTVSFQWNQASSGVGVVRLTPNVEERSIVFPSIPSGEKVYFELQTVEDAFGNNSYPKEFMAFAGDMGHRRDWGVFRQWKREETSVIRDNNGREVFSGWKLVEIWMAPHDKYSVVQQIPGVLVFEDYQELKARIMYHDERW